MNMTTSAHWLASKQTCSPGDRRVEIPQRKHGVKTPGPNLREDEEIEPARRSGRRGRRETRGRRSNQSPQGRRSS